MNELANQSMIECTQSDLNFRSCSTGDLKVLATSYVINWDVGQWVFVLFFLPCVCYTFTYSFVQLKCFINKCTFMDIYKRADGYIHIYTLVRPQDLDEEDSEQIPVK